MRSRVLRCSGPFAGAALAGIVLLAGLWGMRSPVRAEAAKVTWRAQVAPLVYAHCTSCHHEGGSGPFSLMRFEDARRFASVMEPAVTSRYMPPWLPVPGHGEFADSRRLTAEQVALVRAWVAGGMPEGDGAVPQAPVYRGEWELGVPDLLLQTEKAVNLPASGPDVFVNVILPNQGKGTRWVRAMEIKPGSPRIVHHANVILDRTASLRRAHPADWKDGVPGMDLTVDSGETFDPDSHFLFWKPDSTALVEPAGMPWRLDEGNDLVLNLHLKPSGKPEKTAVRVGLYFTEKPAAEHPMLLQLEHDAALDIPAGAKDFAVEDSLKLPVAADVLGVYPHAHYLGKRMEAWVVLPGGARRPLIEIDDWDIDRQSVYRLLHPLALPAGSVVHMRYTYDNSAANVRNPHSPPERVRAGNRSEDEMGHFWLQVLPRPAGKMTEVAAREALERAWMEARLRKSPGDDIALYNLASLDLGAGDAGGAATLYRRALAARPGDARTLTALGSALAASGQWQEARTQYHAALAQDGASADALFDLGTLDLRQGEFVEAEKLFRILSTAHPGDASAQAGLGNALLGLERPAEAQAAFARSLELAPASVEARIGLARVALARGDTAGAEPLLLAAAAIRPDGDAERELALLYAAKGSLALALDHLRAWASLAPKDPDPHRALAQVYGQMGQLEDGLREQRTVTALAPQSSNDWNDLGAMEGLAGDKVGARREFQHALRLDPGNAAAKNNLGKL